MYLAISGALSRAVGRSAPQDVSSAATSLGSPKARICRAMVVLTSRRGTAPARRASSSADAQAGREAIVAIASSRSAGERDAYRFRSVRGVSGSLYAARARIDGPRSSGSSSRRNSIGASPAVRRSTRFARANRRAPGAAARSSTTARKPDSALASPKSNPSAAALARMSESPRSASCRDASGQPSGIRARLSPWTASRAPSSTSRWKEG